MAEGKKGFVLYTDLIHTVKKMPKEKAGELFIHILEYVNDLNPETDDLIVNLTFEPIKQQLKRDLKKYESICNRNKINGLKGGRPKNPIEPKEPTGLTGNPNKPKKPDSDNDIDNDIDIKKTLLSELKNSDFDNSTYFEITISFYELFKLNLQESGVSTAKIEKSKGTWIDSIRLLIEQDKYTIEDLRDVFKFLQTSDFWKPNILSTSKLREKFDKLLLNARKNGENKQGNSQGCTNEELAEVIGKHFAIDKKE